ncbi:DUF1833 family protein [Prosthecomicrobium pneumaticum]|uniref:Uncharacterized protein n=1 Tax=Prosthecomicrobium pneumaticum TaxID=81895 RepID=A0A7W9FQ01_9HYPH|nr:DUF1833 family protein [Prosthecomicrobium pneumaticum]MBB5754631.1 hypothetical protein [Prosthecomicrobium pneumaticum]
MPRALSASLRRALESRASGDANLVFLTIDHPNLAEPVRLVLNTVDMIRDGVTWTAMPFEAALLSDDDQPPTAQLSVPNIDRRIGEVVRGLTSPARVTLELLSSADFDLTVTPHEPTGTPAAFYTARNLYLIEVEGDVQLVQGQLKGWDYLQRTWPGRRANPSQAPAEEPAPEPPPAPGPSV